MALHSTHEKPKLLTQELEDLKKDPPANCSAGPSGYVCGRACMGVQRSQLFTILAPPPLAHSCSDDLFHWQATIMVRVCKGCGDEDWSTA